MVSQRKSRRERLWGKISWSTDVRTVFYDEYDNLEKGRKGERKHRHEEVGLGTADSGKGKTMMLDNPAVVLEAVASATQ